MKEREQENFEIGQEVFKNVSSSFAGRAFITDTFPPLNSLRFFYESKLIFNKMNGDVYTFKDFKRDTKLEINAEYEYQKSMRQLLNKLIDENRWNEATDEFIKQSISDSELRVKDYEKKLSRLTEIKDSGQSFDIEKIKQIPITDIMEFNKAGFACCPFHGEKTPSLKYYKKNNRFHCFGCGKDGDVIDMFQQLHSCNFREAVKNLSEKYI
jgi:hypothetical protein